MSVTANKIQSYNFRIDKKNLKNYYLFRYFPSFLRLESFLTHGLYLTRADKFSDNLECVNYDDLLEIKKNKDYVRLLPEHNLHLSSKELQQYINQSTAILEKLAVKIAEHQKKYFISCWYISKQENENELMWRSYGASYKQNCKGFLVRVRLDDFMDELSRIESSNPHLSKLVYGNVLYYDFNKENSVQKVKFTGFRKHESFKDESEFRLISYGKEPTSDDDNYIKLSKWFYSGVTISAHPEFTLNEYHDFRINLESKFDVSLALSELYIWYKLKETLNKSDKLKNHDC